MRRVTSLAFRLQGSRDLHIWLTEPDFTGEVGRQTLQVEASACSQDVMAASLPVWCSLAEDDGGNGLALVSVYSLCPCFSQGRLRGDLVLLCNCVRVLPHSSPVSSPNLRHLSPDR